MKYIHKVISSELAKEINDMVKRVNEFFGMDITFIQASKIIAWKSRMSKLNLTSQELTGILGGKL